MAFIMARKKKYKFQVEVIVEELTDVPFVNAVLFAKVRLLDGGGFSETSSKLEVVNHSVRWAAKFQFVCKMSANASTGVLDPCTLRVSVRKELKGGWSYQKVGFSDLNLAEFAGSGQQVRRCLLEGYDARHRQDNSMLQVYIRMNMLSGDILFKVPSSTPVQKEEENGDKCGVAVVGVSSGSLSKKRTGLPPESNSDCFDVAVDPPPEDSHEPGHSRNSSNTSQMSKASGYSSLNSQSQHSRQSSSGDSGHIRSPSWPVWAPRLPSLPSSPTSPLEPAAFRIKLSKTVPPHRAQPSPSPRLSVKSFSCSSPSSFHSPAMKHRLLDSSTNSRSAPLRKINPTATSPQDCDETSPLPALLIRRSSLLNTSTGSGGSETGSLDRAKAALKLQKQAAARVEITRVNPDSLIDELLRSTNLTKSDSKSPCLKLFIAKDGTAALSGHDAMNPVAGALQQVVIEERR